MSRAIFFAFLIAAGSTMAVGARAASLNNEFDGNCGSEECSSEQVGMSASRGDFEGRSAGRFGVELHLGGYMEASWLGAGDDYVKNLKKFGLERAMGNKWVSVPYFSVAAHWRFHPSLSLVMAFSPLERRDYNTKSEYEGDEDVVFSWRTYRLGVYLRGQFDLFRGWVRVYGSAGGGLGFGVTEYKDELANADVFSDESDSGLSAESFETERYREEYLGYHLAAGAGISLVPWRHVGFHLIDAQAVWAPIIENKFGHTHQSGGLVLAMGVFATF